MMKYKDRASPKMYGLIRQQSREDITASGKAMNNARPRKSKLDHSGDRNYLRSKLMLFSYPDTVVEQILGVSERSRLRKATEGYQRCGINSVRSVTQSLSY